MSQQMGPWSYFQLTSLHLAFIKLALSKFVALESRGRLLPSQIHRQTHPMFPHPFATVNPMLPHIFATKFAPKRSQSARRRYPVKAHYVVTDHSNIHSDAHATISHEQNFCAFSVGKRPSSIVIQKRRPKIWANTWSEQRMLCWAKMCPGAVDDDEFTRASI